MNRDLGALEEVWVVTHQQVGPFREVGRERLPRVPVPLGAGWLPELVLNEPFECEAAEGDVVGYVHHRRHEARRKEEAGELEQYLPY